MRVRGRTIWLLFNDNDRFEEGLLKNWNLELQIIGLVSIFQIKYLNSQKTSFVTNDKAAERFSCIYIHASKKNALLKKGDSKLIKCHLKQNISLE